ncbi:hypothetical protein [Thermaerobacillus caldiproteolyticus]|uniref:Uncharacterized protein n=1 Tax=Thermaerobacillus caldiproteolyticus TaxID=247480 RepID=A0A7V9Z3W7_9BACL|nr:hypothetical protein [Anoxybacillus caldiproteolyticus]MBA2873541.1 hypothetical protein [Anoxybacillus caldiproteolyticus]QPA30130.1 hypothetical protein ISX45_10760 [Anoxybacillus caldiproteolyticus]
MRRLFGTRELDKTTEKGYFSDTVPAMTRRMSAKKLIQAADTLRAELNHSPPKGSKI